jgi:hypothetical protein
MNEKLEEIKQRLEQIQAKSLEQQPEAFGELYQELDAQLNPEETEQAN